MLAFEFGIFLLTINIVRMLYHEHWQMEIYLLGISHFSPKHPDRMHNQSSLRRSSFHLGCNHRTRGQALLDNRSSNATLADVQTHLLPSVSSVSTHSSAFYRRS